MYVYIHTYIHICTHKTHTHTIHTHRYILGRCQVGTREYNRAHFAYQQAVYRDERNPTLWCSIGILYYKIGQYKEALDAYSKAIRFNPYMSAVWYNLGTLYESCKQPPDAKDAYQHAMELDNECPLIRERLQRLALVAENPSVALDELPALPPVIEPVPIKALEAAGTGTSASTSTATIKPAMESKPAVGALAETSMAGVGALAEASMAAPGGMSSAIGAGDVSRFQASGSQVSPEAAEVARKMAAEGGLLGLGAKGASIAKLMPGCGGVGAEASGSSLLGLVAGIGSGSTVMDVDRMDEDKESGKDGEDGVDGDDKAKDGRKKKENDQRESKRAKGVEDGDGKGADVKSESGDGGGGKDGDEEEGLGDGGGAEKKSKSSPRGDSNGVSQQEADGGDKKRKVMDCVCVCVCVCVCARRQTHMHTYRSMGRKILHSFACVRALSLKRIPRACMRENTRARG